MTNPHDNESVLPEKTDVVSFSYPEIPDLDIYHVLGKGGSGTVYKGRQPFLKRDVAIKILNVVNDAIDDEFVERFHREAQILADLIHPHIVSCFQAGMTRAANGYPQSPFLAMEYIDGPSLLEWIHQQGKIDQFIALGIIEKIASALDYAHKKTIIHRDIKAENILLKPDVNTSDDGEMNFIPKLADLGIARSTRSAQEDNLTMVGTMIGTPSSMAPEQFNEPDNIDFKADIYGLGCVLFHLVTGKKPFEGYNLTDMVFKKNSQVPLDPREINPHLNRDVVKLIFSMMAMDKNKRPESYEDLIQQCQFIASALNEKNKKQKIAKPYFYAAPIVVILLATLLYFLFEKSVQSIVIDETVSSEITDDIATDVVAAANNNNSEPKNLNYLLLIQYLDKNKKNLSPGELFDLKITTFFDGYLYCYFENQYGEVIRFFPNRFEEERLIIQEQPVILPGENPFELSASVEGKDERIACFATNKSMLKKLPDTVIGVDFEKLPINSLEQVKEFFLFNNTDINISAVIFDVRVN